MNGVKNKTTTESKMVYYSRINTISMNLKKSNILGLILLLTALFAVLVIAYAQNENTQPQNQPETPTDNQDTQNKTTNEETEALPIYVTLSAHIEDGGNYNECSRYPDSRFRYLEFADLFSELNLPLNLQIDYEFLNAVHECDTPNIQSITGNTNLVDYLAKHYLFEIDAHQGGGYEIPGKENYADVRFMAGLVSTKTTETVGGVMWNQEGQYERFAAGEQGILHPEFTWYPELLTMGAHFKHHTGDFSLDDRASGIWKPKGFGNDFYTHDPEGSMIYIGSGYINPDFFGKAETNPENNIDYIQTLVDALEDGSLDRTKMYTATIGIPQSLLTADGFETLLIQIEKLLPLAQQGKVEFVTFTQAVEIWKTTYNEEPNTLRYEEVLER